jgi:hypothetical protein
MSTGPVQYVIVGFPENRFTGEIAPELASLVDSGIVRILDLVFITRDADGDVLAIEVDEDENLTALAAIDGEVGGLIGPDDIAHAAESIESGSSVLLIVWENVWATSLSRAIRDSGGVLLEGAIIPADLIDAAEAELAAAT